MFFRLVARRLVVSTYRVMGLSLPITRSLPPNFLSLLDHLRLLILYSPESHIPHILVSFASHRSLSTKCYYVAIRLLQPLKQRSQSTMVFLPCPKFSRGGDESSDTVDNTSVSENNNQLDAPETTSQLRDNDSEHDRQALENIFGPSTPQSSRNRVRVSLRSRSSLTKRKSMGRIKNRVSMKALSNKLRRRFSRDANLGKNSKATIRGAADIFADDSGSINYDSDAQDILTPQLTAVDDSPYAITKRKGSADRNVAQITQRTSTMLSNGVDSTRTPDRAHSTEVGTPQPTNHGFVDVNNSRAAAAHDGRTVTITPRESMNAASNAVSAPAVGPKAESPVYFTPPDHRSPAPDGRYYPKSSKGPHDASPGPSIKTSESPTSTFQYPPPDHPPPPIPDRHPARRASIHGSPVSRSNSMYSQRPPSFLLASTEIRQISPRAERKASTRSRVVSGLADIPEAGKMDLTNDHDDRSSKEVAQPTGPVASVPQGLGRSHTLHVPKRNASVGRQSRFREDFDVTLTDEGPVSLARSKTTREHVRKSSEGWLSGGRRLGFGYDFVSRPTPSASPAKDVTGAAKEATNNEQQDAKARAVQVIDRERVDPAESSPNENLQDVPLTALPSVSVNPAESDTKAAPVKRSFSIREWARLPSGRKERRSSAGTDSNNEPVTSNIAVTATEGKANEETSKPRKGEGLFHALSLSKGKKFFQRQTPSSDSLPSEIIELGRTARGEDVVPNPYTHFFENPNRHSGSPDVSIAHIRGSSTYSPLLRPAGYDGPRDTRPHPLSSLDGSLENQNPLTQVRTADSWSQIYQDCLPELTMSEESEAIVEARARVEKGQETGKKLVASALEAGMAVQEEIASRRAKAKEGLR